MFRGDGRLPVVVPLTERTFMYQVRCSHCGKWVSVNIADIPVGIVFGKKNPCPRCSQHIRLGWTAYLRQLVVVLIVFGLVVGAFVTWRILGRKLSVSLIGKGLSWFDSMGVPDSTVGAVFLVLMLFFWFNQGYRKAKQKRSSRPP